MFRTGDFLNKTNYLVGFLAALIGLAAFKDELAAIKIGVFSLKFSLLEVSIPMILIMLLAAYLGALSQFLGNITITKVPISKYLNIGSNTVAILALMYPVLFSLILGVAKLIELLVANDSTSIVHGVLYAGTFTSLLAAFIASLISAISLNKLRQDNDLARVFERLKSEESRSNNLKPRDFLQSYEELVTNIVTYLKLRGYGVGGRGLHALARILQTKNIYDAMDVDYAAELNEIRNSYAHGKQDLELNDLRKMMRKISLLQTKILNAMYVLEAKGE